MGLQINRLELRLVDESMGVRSDQVVWLKLPKSTARYLERFRRITYRDPATAKKLVFLANNFELPAATIAQL